MARLASPSEARRSTPAGTKPDGVHKDQLEWIRHEGQELRDAFVGVFGGRYRPFGNRAHLRGGLSDGNDGVQWNAAYDRRTDERWLGVNLEGMQYQDWPIGRLIQRELRAPTLV